jgi:DNA-binding phage protein
MPLTKDFRETILARAQRDPEFRQELLREGVECLLAGDIATGKLILRDYINATVGFAALGEKTERSPKTLMRMFGPTGNPNARTLLQVVALLQQFEGVQFELLTRKTAA